MDLVWKLGGTRGREERFLLLTDDLVNGTTTQVQIVTFVYTFYSYEFSQLYFFFPDSQWYRTATFPFLPT